MTEQEKIRQAAHDVYKVDSELNRIYDAKRRLLDQQMDAHERHAAARDRLTAAVAGYKTGTQLVAPLTGFDVDSPTALIITCRGGHVTTDTAILMDPIEIEPDDLPF